MLEVYSRVAIKPAQKGLPNTALHAVKDLNFVGGDTCLEPVWHLHEFQIEGQFDWIVAIDEELGTEVWVSPFFGLTNCPNNQRLKCDLTMTKAVLNSLQNSMRKFLQRRRM